MEAKAAKAVPPACRSATFAGVVLVIVENAGKHRLRIEPRIPTAQTFEYSIRFAVDSHESGDLAYGEGAPHQRKVWRHRRPGAAT